MVGRGAPSYRPPMLGDLLRPLSSLESSGGGVSVDYYPPTAG